MPELKNLLTTTDDVNAAADRFLEVYENPKYKNYDARRSYANQFFEQFAGKTSEDGAPGLSTTMDASEGEQGVAGDPTVEAAKDAEEVLKDREAAAEEAPIVAPAEESNMEVTDTTEDAVDPSLTSGKGRYKTGVATQALKNNANYVGKARAITQPNVHIPTNAGLGSGNGYEQLLQTIIASLATIATNTGLLNQILQALNNGTLGTGNGDPADIDSAVGGSRAKGQAALDRLIEQSRGNSRGISTLLGNKDTEYIIEAMTALVRE